MRDRKKYRMILPFISQASMLFVTKIKETDTKNRNILRQRFIGGLFKNYEKIYKYPTHIYRKGRQKSSVLQSSIEEHICSKSNVWEVLLALNNNWSPQLLQGQRYYRLLLLYNCVKQHSHTGENGAHIHISVTSAALKH